MPRVLFCPLTSCLHQKLEWVPLCTFTSAAYHHLGPTVQQVPAQSCNPVNGIGNVEPKIIFLINVFNSRVFHSSVCLTAWFVLMTPSTWSNSEKIPPICCLTISSIVTKRSQSTSILNESTILLLKLKYICWNYQSNAYIYLYFSTNLPFCGLCGVTVGKKHSTVCLLGGTLWTRWAYWGHTVGMLYIGNTVRILWAQCGNTVGTLWAYCGHTDSTIWPNWEQWAYYGHTIGILLILWVYFRYTVGTLRENWAYYGHNVHVKGIMWVCSGHNVVILWRHCGHTYPQ